MLDTHEELLAWNTCEQLIALPPLASAGFNEEKELVLSWTQIYCLAAPVCVRAVWLTAEKVCQRQDGFKLVTFT